MRIVLLALFGICVPAWAQVTVRIDDAPAVMLSASDLAKLPRHKAVLDDHGKQVSYEGVLLRDLLARNGVSFDKGLHGKQLASYVALIASDGYEVVVALGDLDPTIADCDVTVADKREGQTLDSKEGPLRIVVPHDKRPARSLRMLQEIDVVQLRK